MQPEASSSIPTLIPGDVSGKNVTASESKDQLDTMFSRTFRTLTLWILILVGIQGMALGLNIYDRIRAEHLFNLAREEHDRRINEEHLRNLRIPSNDKSVTGRPLLHGHGIALSFN